ncbi:MAG: hypothetical protein ACE5ER_04115 [Nitrospinaceae bacterium]
MDVSDWRPVSTGIFTGLTAGGAVLGWLLIFQDPIGGDSWILLILHQTNLVFHEFGHLFFSIFGDTIGILGGTLGQLCIPLLVMAAFFRSRDAAGMACGAFWFFENFLDVAIYMADAHALKLPLIGGLGMEAHDWRNLFLRWDVILHAKTIAGVTATLGWLGFAGTWLWLAHRWRLDRKSL